MATKETKIVEQTGEVIEPVVAEPKTESEPTGWTVSVNDNATWNWRRWCPVRKRKGRDHIKAYGRLVHGA